MLPYFWYLLKVIICSGILLGYYWLFLRNKIFHQYNRFYLLMAMGLSLLLPLLKINFWQQHTETNGAILVLRAVSVGDEYMNSVVITAQKSFWNFQNLYPLLYWLVSLVFVFVLLRTLYIIRTLLKNYPVKQVEEVTFVNTNDDSTPFSFFKYIFWNSSIDMDTVTGRQIFKHEVAHIQEKHTYDKLFVNISLIFFWCNPFFWLYRKELNMIHEFIADKKAVEDSDTAAFAAMILQSAYPRHCFELTNNFFYSPIKRRLRMLTKIDNPRIGYFVRVMVLPLAILVFAAFTFKAKTNTAKEINGKNTLTAIEKNASSQSQFNTAQNNISIADTIPRNLWISAKFSDSAYAKSDDFKNKALVIVDSKEIGNVGNKFVEEGIAKYSTVTIYNQTEAKKIYGVKGKYGVIKLTQKDAILATAKSIYFDDKTKTIKLIGPDISLKGDLSNALIYLENKIISADILKTINPEKISSVTVLQGDKLNDITDAKGKKSVIYISLKADDLPEVTIKAKSKTQPLYVIDGVVKEKEFNGGAMKTDEIASVNILKGEQAVAKYGTKGINGVIEIKTKKTDNITVTASDINVSADKGIMRNDNTDLTLVGKVNINGDLSGTNMYVDGKQVTEKEYKAIDTKHIESVNIKSDKNLNKKIIYVSLKKDNPRIYIGDIASTKADVEHFKKQKEIRVTQGYSFLSTTVYFSGKGFDKVVMAQLNSSSLKPVKDYIERCTAGSVVTFDNIQVKDGNGVMMEIDGRAFLLIDGSEKITQDAPVISDANSMQSSQENKIFIKTETPPQFIGGQQGWRDFLRKNLKANIPVDSGASAGKYTVIVRFIIHTDGSVSDIKCEKDPGYGTCEEVKRIIKESSKKWEPAVQNGKKVNAYHRQPVTFVVEE